MSASRVQFILSLCLWLLLYEWSGSSKIWCQIYRHEASHATALRNTGGTYKSASIRAFDMSTKSTVLFCRENGGFVLHPAIIQFLTQPTLTAPIEARSTVITQRHHRSRSLFVYYCCVVQCSICRYSRPRFKDTRRFLFLKVSLTRGSVITSQGTITHHPLG